MWIARLGVLMFVMCMGVLCMSRMATNILKRAAAKLAMHCMSCLALGSEAVQTGALWFDEQNLFLHAKVVCILRSPPQWEGGAL